MKKLLALVLSLVTAVCLFAACGPKGDSAKESSSIKSDIEFDQFGDPIFNNVNLNVWSVIGAPDNEYLNLVNEMFNSYYRSNGIQATITSIETSLFYTQLANTITTDPANAPDVVIFHSERLTYLVDNNLLLSIDECLSYINRTFKSENYFVNVLEECRVDNSLYGVPLDVHSGLWFVREDILTKNGLAKPTTKAEFEAVCEALMQKKANGTLWTRAMDRNNSANTEWRQIGAESDFFPVEMSAADNIESGWIPQTAVVQNGEPLVNDKGEPAWNNSNGLKTTLEMIDSWEGKYIGENRDHNTLWSNLASGNAVFGMEGPWWAEGRLNEYDAVLGEGALTVMGLSGLYANDANSASKNKVYGVGHCFSVVKTVKSAQTRAAAALYAEYMTENAIKYMAGGHLPACKAIQNNPEYTSSRAYNRYLKYMGNPEDFVMLGNTPHYSEVYEKLKLAYIYTLSKNKNGTVSDFISECYRKAMGDIMAKEDL